MSGGLRCEALRAPRLIAHFVFVYMTTPYLGASSGRPGQFPGQADNVFMEQVTASNLSQYDVTAISDGVRPQVEPRRIQPSRRWALKATPRIVAAVHTHSPANLAVSAQNGPASDHTAGHALLQPRRYYPNVVGRPPRPRGRRSSRARSPTNDY